MGYISKIGTCCVLWDQKIFPELVLKIVLFYFQALVFSPGNIQRNQYDEFQPYDEQLMSIFLEGSQFLNLMK